MTATYCNKCNSAILITGDKGLTAGLLKEWDDLPCYTEGCEGKVTPVSYEAYLALYAAFGNRYEIDDKEYFHFLAGRGKGGEKDVTLANIRWLFKNNTIVGVEGETIGKEGERKVKVIKLQLSSGHSVSLAGGDGAFIYKISEGK